MSLKLMFKHAHNATNTLHSLTLIKPTLMGINICIANDRKSSDVYKTKQFQKALSLSLFKTFPVVNYIHSLCKQAFNH